jgi:RNA polymerase sigma-70 factor, ECF subfamily
MTAGDRAFAAVLEREAAPLASFVLALVGERHCADDLYQSTCLELWRIRDTFRPGTDFGAWSRTVARYQVMRHFRKTGREKVMFSSAAVDKVAAAYAARPGGTRMDDLRAALERCLERVAPAGRTLLRERYHDNVPVRTLAERNGRTESGLKMALMRLRQELARCVQARLGGKERGDA